MYIILAGGGDMTFKFAHNNLNVLDLRKSLDFYAQALGLKETRRIDAPDGNFVLVFLGDGVTPHRLELTWLRDRKKKYDLGDNEIHLAFTTPDYPGAHAQHKKMGCICYENEKMGIYFIEDPDGYWLEILPEKR
jgi:lactoylglutathione lyase